MNIERDKFLVQKLGWIFPYPNDCPEYMWHPERGKHSLITYWSFSEWSIFGELWEWAQKQEWWVLFKRWKFGDSMEWDEQLINPNRFADAVYAYLKEEQE